MSWWDRYFAPGDVRRQRQLEERAEEQVAAAFAERNAQALKPLPEQQPGQRIDAAHRQRRQDGLLYGGLAFTVLSLLVTRRSLAKKQLLHPKTFTPSTADAAASPVKADGTLDAIEALGLATLNVFSVAMVAAGAAAKWFDVADLEDLRNGVRSGLGFDVYGGEAEADKELETWVADVLRSKDGPLDLRKGIAEKLRELEDKERTSKSQKNRD